VKSKVTLYRSALLFFSALINIQHFFLSETFSPTKKGIGMKTFLLSLLFVVSVLLLWGCESKSPESDAASSGVKTIPSMESDLAEIVPNYDIARSGAQVGVWTTDYEAALKLAKEKKIPVILNFTGSDWCKYCKLLIRDVFSQKEWQDWVADKFILVYIDFPRNLELISEELLKQNSTLREKFAVEAFPTLLVLEDDGLPLGMVEMRDDNSVLTVRRNLKAIMRRRKSVIQEMISSLPEEKRIETQGFYDKLNSDQQKMSEMAKKYEEDMRKLEANLRELSEKTEAAILEHLLSQRTPEQQQQYAEGKKKMDELQQQLQTWLNNEPEQSQQNMLLYQNFQRQLQEQSDILADIIDPN
jgi:thioredoxin-related protein